MRLRSKLLTEVRLVVAAALFVAAAAPAFARSWQIANFHDSISVSADGSTLVRERITLSFEGEWNGIHRTIPIEYPGPHGTNYTLFLNVLSVTDGSGSKLKYDSSTHNSVRDLKIYLPGTEDTTRTVEIDYAVRNAIRYFDDHDEFYWNVTGNDWPVPIAHVDGDVEFPANAAGSLRAQSFTGVYGSTEGEANTTVKGSVVAFESTRPLPMRGGLTIDVFIPKGLLKEPSGLTRLGWFLGSNPIVFLPFWTLLVMYLLWYYKGRDPDPGVSVAPMYEPPEGMSPAEVGTLIDDSTDPRDITSTIVDLAVRGFIKIEETKDEGVIFHHKDYILHLLIPRAKWTGLRSHEQVMLTNIFDTGDQVQLSSLKNHFYTALPVIRQDIMAELKEKGMYLVTPAAAGAYSVGGAIASAAPFLILQFAGIKDVFSAIAPLVISAILAALIWWLFARQMTAKTVKGGSARVAILGFQDFMNRVDADRLKRMPPDTFEKYLAYAMALGVEHHWAQAFQGLIQNPPAWYVGPGGFYPGTFSPIFFSNSMLSMTTSMHQVFVSAPRASSSGSGFGGGGFSSGGGFSGGGFGGGGGGAF
jgi:uncharacterized membrane protein